MWDCVLSKMNEKIHVMLLPSVSSVIETFGLYFKYFTQTYFPGQIATFPGTLTDKLGGSKPKTVSSNHLEASEFDQFYWLLYFLLTLFVF